MPKVSNLVIKAQTGSSGTHFASWDFTATKTTTTSSGLKAGSLVTIKSGATYYNGVSIPSWVMSDKWYLTQVKGDRAVLGKNPSGTHNIVSAINTKYLNNYNGTTVTTTTQIDNLDHYEVKWYYATGDGVWFSGGSSDVKEKNATYSTPDNATKIKVTVKPVSKTYTKNNKETYYWTGTAVTAEYYPSNDPPDKPGTPTVKIEKYKLTASLENIADSKTDQIQFEVYNGTKKYKTGTVSVVTRQASYSCDISAGGDYRVRCRAINTANGTTYSAWSDYTSSATTIPTAPSKITALRSTSETSVYIEWSSVKGAKTYNIQRATEKRYFDGSDQITTTTGIETNHYELSGLESGDEYFFRVCAVNDNGESAWSEIKSVVIGKDPSAPTTWSSSTTVISGEQLTLYWVHNSEDGSSQTYADLELYINGVKETYTIKNSTEEDEKDKTSFYKIDTSKYSEGTTIQWRVRTAGITKNYGDWSVQRTIDIYAPPTLELNIVDKDGNELSTIESFPFYISAMPGPKTQQPIGYHVSITADESYETVDSIGNVQIVSAGDAVYERYFDVNQALMVEMSAGNVNLDNDISYTITCTVSMDSGLTADNSVGFNVSWTDVIYEPNAEIAVDEYSYVCYIRPYCADDDYILVDDVTLSVYRREYDGGFTEIATGIVNTENTVVTDPHPALDYARYRIVATSISTGSVSFYDMPGYPVGCPAVIIQWDEEWSSYDTSEEEAMEQPAWTGSMLKLPYNVDVSDKNDIDVSLVEYIGRSHPISYYGTHKGQTATWNMDIEKSDKETVYALRRLANYMGDVYVREPSGSGYWANISVSFSQKHKELTIPVTLDIKRVEGGM